MVSVSSSERVAPPYLFVGPLCSAIIGFQSPIVFVIIILDSSSGGHANKFNAVGCVIVGAAGERAGLLDDATQAVEIGINAIGEDLRQSGVEV